MSDPGPYANFRYLLLPVLFSLAMGLLVVFDSRIASYHPLWQPALNHEIARNYLWTGTALILIVALAIASYYRAWLFERRFQIFVVLLLASPALGGLNLGGLDPPDVVMVLATLFWLGSVMVEDRPVLIPRVIIAIMLGLIGFTVGSIMTNGIYIVLSLPSVISKLMIFFLLANLIATPRDHELAIRAFIVITLLSAVIAILITAVYLLTGYVFTLDDRTDEQFKCLGWICMLRATALTPTPQVLGHLLILGLGLTLFLRVRFRLHLFLLAVIGVGAMTTLSVGVFLSVGVVFVLFPIFRWPAYYAQILTAYLTAAWISHVTGLWALVYHTANDLLLASYGANIRIWTYRGGAELIDKNPIFGIGALRQIHGSMHFTTPHNAYIQIALELGLPAALLFVSLLVYLFVSCWRLAANASDAATRNRMRGLLLGFTGMLVHLLSEPFYTSNLPWTYMGLITAGIIIYSQSGDRRQWAVRGATARVQRMARTLQNSRRQS